jgi:hypothetical protein
MALLNSFWAAGLQLTGKFTSPSFSLSAFPAGSCLSSACASGVPTQSIIVNIAAVVFAKVIFFLKR